MVLEKQGNRVFGHKHASIPWCKKYTLILLDLAWYDVLDDVLASITEVVTVAGWRHDHGSGGAGGRRSISGIAGHASVAADAVD